MKKLSNLLIVLGIILLAAPLVGNLITQRQQAQMIAQYESSLVDSFAVTDLPEAAPETGAVIVPAAAAAQEETPKEVASAKPKLNLPVIGRIKIGKINLDLPIIQGIDSQSLRYGIGYMAGSGGLGKVGNAVLAGHRNYPFGQLFNRLDEVAIGDLVVVKANKKKYVYVVYEKLVVEPKDVSVIKKMGDQKMLTLVTCTPKGKDTHRLIIHARLQ